MEGSKRQIRCGMRVFANAVMYSYVKKLTAYDSDQAPFLFL